MINNESFRALGIIGNPLKQSLSPYLHNYWIRQYKISSYYLPLSIKRITHIKRSLKTLNFLGLNVTIPYKKKIIQQLDSIDKSAKVINAVNTLLYKNNNIKGYNTDIIGFKKGLINKKWDKERPVIIFGAGGAAEAIVYFLKSENIKDITIINRTKNNAEKIIKRYESIKFKHKAEEYIKEAGLIINTTSLGMIGYPDLNLKLNKVNKEAIIYDIVYNPVNTNLIKEAKKNKLTTITGLEMFIEQARESFSIWFNIQPKVNDKLITNIKRSINR
ncbi:MAG: shikimate dehydrogenase [Alphaproteobacteria bacterium TMED62]|nr:MAG: shikimate dehydrogenase [Alphaproteobacteria bacterium TMED62]|tara:strand:- start:15410 stop:16231 length:822 start_codon:yes stop_codon:yes gene_type:complete